MTTNKRKTTTAIVAGVTAVALLLGGTFAWTSISQQAKNESAGIVNVGGRLHDDFNGENKDVYVENFTDPLNGGQPIYARVKLTEYMEVGKEAGQADNADRNAVPVVNDTDINDKDNWPVHIPAEYCNICQTGDTCKIHDHWTWGMGGQTTYMPTFNKDKDSLDADINGTYAGTNPDDKIYYDDYVTYVTENGIAVDMNDADFVAPEGATNATPLTEAAGDVTSVTGNEYYDDDTDTDENDHATGTGVRNEENVTHTAKLTADGTVITMAEWLANPVPGNYWVYDEDGWAYWANPIMPGEATGLLLSNIKMEKNPGEKCYYAINVVGQFATVNDWEYFYNENNEFDGTDNALTLLETASKNVATVVVTNVSGATLLTPGSSYEFGANVYVNGVAKYAADNFEWSVLDANNKVSENSNVTIDENGKAMLNVGASETNKNLIVVAKALDANYLGALGMSSVAVDVVEITVSLDITLYGYDTVYLPMEAGESKSYQLAFSTSELTEDVAQEKFYLSGAYLDDGTTTALTEGTDYTYNQATQILTVTQRDEGVRFEFLPSEDSTEPVYGLNFSVPVTPMAALMGEANDNNTYMAALITEDAENVFYRVNLTEDGTEDGTPIELSDIQLSGEYNNGVTYDSETNLLFVPNPSESTVLEAKYGECNVYIVAMSETDYGNRSNYYLEGGDFLEEGSEGLFTKVSEGNYTKTIEAGRVYSIQYIAGDADDLVFEAAEGYPLGDGLAIATMLYTNDTDGPADMGQSYLNVSEDYTGEIHLKGYYYLQDTDTDTGAYTYTKHEVSIILTVIPAE